MAKKKMSQKQKDYLRKLAAEGPADASRLPGLDDEEAARLLESAFDLDPVTAAEIAAIERDQIDGDVVFE